MDGSIGQDWQPVDANTIDQLKFCEQFLIWSVRTWAQTTRTDPNEAHQMTAELRRAFEYLELEESYLTFDRFMTYLVSSLKRPLRLHFPRCGGVSPDEIAILRMIHDLQNQQAAAAFMNLGEYVAPAAVRVAIGALAELSTMFARNGLTVRRLAVPPSEPEAFQPPEPCRHADPVTIH